MSRTVLFFGLVFRTHCDAGGGDMFWYWQKMKSLFVLKNDNLKIIEIVVMMMISRGPTSGHLCCLRRILGTGDRSASMVTVGGSPTFSNRRPRNKSIFERVQAFVRIMIPLDTAAPRRLYRVHWPQEAEVPNG